MESAIAHVLESGEERTSDVAAGSSSFEELQLDRNILKGLQTHKFLTPTKIQAAAIPMAFAGMDMLVQSKSGTGKTLIYVLAALQLLNKKLALPQVLIIVPTRELAIQVEDTANGLSQSMHNRNFYHAVSYIGGTDVRQDRLRMAKGRIVVGTPGRLLHLVHNQVFNTTSIKLLVLDEADQLFATQSLQKDVQQLLAALGSKCQIIACSATYPNKLDERLAKLMDKPILVSNSERATVLLGVRQFVYELPEQLNSMQEMLAKLEALRKIFDQLHYEQGILFASSQSRADSFRNYLKRNGVECDLMSGAMKQSDRLETFQAYRNFKTRTMVATDLMARGVDSSHANLVINLDPPKDLVTYLHRIGRAGRFGSKGIAITFISSPQQCQHFKRIIAEAGTGMSVLQFPQEQQRAGFDFWNFESYDFPYFQKIEAHEQEEEELKRIKQRWKGKLDAMQTVEATEAAPVENPVELELEQQHEELKSALVAEVKAALEEELFKQLVEKPLNNELEDDRQLIPSPQINLPVNSTPQEIKSPLQAPTQLQLAVNPYEQQASPIEPMELTPSTTDVPAAAPNSINTKTYCLVAPTDRSSTTLLPLGISNTVDDASSIISDSMENDYDSDASYSSCYTLSDARIIWQRACIQHKLQRRRKRQLAKRRSCHLNLRQCKVKVVSERVKRNKRKNKVNLEAVEEPDVSTLTLHKQETPKLRERYFDGMVSERFLLISKRFNCIRLLKKFDNLSGLQELLRLYYVRNHMTLRKLDRLLEQVYDAMQHFYYVDHKKAKAVFKPILPEISNVDNYNKFMKLLNLQPAPYEQPKRELPIANQLERLTVHVNQQVNIMPIVVAAAAAESDENGNSQSSGSESFSENESEDAESVEPYSSSGFVESTESASSGIETSEYSSNTSSNLNLNYNYDEEEVEEEAEEVSTGEENDDVDDDNEECSEYSLSLTVESDEYDNNVNTDDDDEKEEEEEQAAAVSAAADPAAADADDDDDDDDVTLHNPDDDAANHDLAVAQERWKRLFEHQYQFIANYVDNYMETYRQQY